MNAGRDSRAGGIPYAPTPVSGEPAAPAALQQEEAAPGRLGTGADLGDNIDSASAGVVPPTRAAIPAEAVSLVASADANGIRGNGALQVALERCDALDRAVKVLSGCGWAVRDRMDALTERLAEVDLLVQEVATRLQTVESKLQPLFDELADAEGEFARHMGGIERRLAKLEANPPNTSELAALKERIRAVAHLLRIADDLQAVGEGAPYLNAALALSRGEHLEGE